MKKSFYLIAMAAVMAACSGNKQYTITGTVEGAQDGDSVFIKEAKDGELISVTGGVVKNGVFTITGRQDSVVTRYLTYENKDGDTYFLDFFLENGKIQVRIDKNASSATGTPNNDIYQQLRDGMNKMRIEAEKIYTTLADTTIDETKRELTLKSLDDLDHQMNKTANEFIAKNITNPAGVYMLKQQYYSMDVNELTPIVEKIPANYKNDPVIQRILDSVERMKATAIGQKFTDFEMDTPDGKKIKVSDFAGKGKVVLIDFWASWCGPCRQEMPNVVEAYHKFKDKGFEIIGVSFDLNAEAWKKGISDLGMTWPQMSDLKYWDSEAAHLYAVNAIPHSVLLDGNGIIIAKNLRGDELAKKIEEAIK